MLGAPDSSVDVTRSLPDTLSGLPLLNLIVRIVIPVLRHLRFPAQTCKHNLIVSLSMHLVRSTPSL